MVNFSSPVSTGNSFELSNIGHFTFKHIKNIILNDRFDNLKFFIGSNYICLDKHLYEYEGKHIIITGCSSMEFMSIKSSLIKCDKLCIEEDNLTDTSCETISISYLEDKKFDEIEDEQFKDNDSIDEDKQKQEILMTNKKFNKMISEDEDLLTFVKLYYKNPEYLKTILLMENGNEYENDFDFSQDEMSDFNDTVSLIQKQTGISDGDVEELLKRSNGNIYSMTKILFLD
jgi:hypothetical protein